MSKVGKMTMLMGMQWSLVGPLRYSYQSHCILLHITEKNKSFGLGSGTETNIEDQHLYPDKKIKSTRNKSVCFIINIAIFRF